MLQLAPHRLLGALAENVAKTIGLTAIAKRALRRGECGGVRWVDQSLESNVRHVRHIASLVESHVNVRNRVGAEIGPGDNLGASYCLLKAGASKIYAVEKFGSVAADAHCERLFMAIDAEVAGNVTASEVLQRGESWLRFNRAQLQHAHCLFEDFSPDEPIDFIYSHDVIEHVNPRSVFLHASEILTAGGDFLNVIDLTGHGVFYDLKRPLDFLTCPDWLWPMLFSAMETTNRVRWSELLQLAEDTGFQIIHAKPIRRADPNYLASIRPHLLPRYQALTDDDLSVMQCVLHLRKL